MDVRRGMLYATTREGHFIVNWSELNFIPFADVEQGIHFTGWLKQCEQTTDREPIKGKRKDILHGLRQKPYPTTEGTIYKCTDKSKLPMKG